jgi:CheY-like chemotaxis protein
MNDKVIARVLVVDDNASWLDLIRTILESDGYSVKTATDSAQCERLLASELFDLAIFDIRLTKAKSDVEGVTLLRRAKRLQPGIKAIILTGYPNAKQRQKVLDSFRADGYFEKVPSGQPFDIQSFSHLIHRLLYQDKTL